PQLRPTTTSSLLDGVLQFDASGVAPGSRVTAAAVPSPCGWVPCNDGVYPPVAAALGELEWNELGDCRPATEPDRLDEVPACESPLVPPLEPPAAPDRPPVGSPPVSGAVA
ncbi:MAG: hypothetical protein ACRDXE_08830, partial [Acidimicrobiales bacterium]